MNIKMDVKSKIPSSTCSCFVLHGLIPSLYYQLLHALSDIWISVICNLHKSGNNTDKWFLLFDIIHKFRSSHPRVLNYNIFINILETFWENLRSGISEIGGMNVYNFTNIAIHQGCVPGTFLIFSEQANLVWPS